MKKLLFFSLLLLALLIPTASATNKPVIWVDSLSSPDIAVANNVTEHAGYIWHGWSDTTTKVYSISYSSGISVEPGNQALSGTHTYYIDYITVSTDPPGCVSYDQIVKVKWLLSGDTETCGSRLISPCSDGREYFTVSVKGVINWWQYWVISHSGNWGSTVHSAELYGREWLTNPYILTRGISYDEVGDGLTVVFKATSATLYLVKQDGSTMQLSDGSMLSALPESDFPIRLKVVFSDYGRVKYFGLMPSKYYGYVYDSSGNPVDGALIKARIIQENSEPTGLTASVNGTGNITIYVYKDGQPLQNAKIKVWNPWGLEYFASGATDSNGKIDITGIDTHEGWEATTNYTFLVYDLEAHPVTDDFGEQLKTTITFVDGVPQTNPAVIYNKYTVTEERATYTDVNGYFEFPNLDTSKYYSIEISNQEGTLLYTDTIMPPYYAIYGTPKEDTGGDSGSTPYGDPNSKYIVELSKDRIAAYETVHVYVKDTDGNYVEGADIYLDGVFTGKKTAYVEWWRAIPGFGWMFGWLYDKIFKPTYPVATIQITDNGTHYVHAKVKGVESRAAKIVVGSQDTEELYGGTDAGSYPTTPPDELGNRYVLWADRTALYKNGEVTFKVYKYVNGVKAGSWEAMIYVNDQYVGTTTKSWWNPFAERELKYKFTSPGMYRVHAVVEGEKTGNLVVTVYDSLNEFDSGDGSLNLHVYVKSAATGSPVSGAVVTRVEGGTVKERRLTGINGEAVLHPASGVNYTIYVSDPSNRYLPASQSGSWTSDDSITFYLKPVGDLNNDNTTDSDAPEMAIESIQIRIDGIAEDGAKLPLGKHRISVVDENGKELSDVEIYMNGERIGKTSGWFAWFGAGLEYSFSEPGEVTLHASYNGLADTIVVNFTESMSNYVLLAFKEGSDSAVMGNLEVEVGKKVTFTVAEVDSSKKVHEWRKVEGAIIFLNGNETGVTKTIGGFLGLFSTVGFEKTFDQPGNYTVSAKYGDAETNSVNVTVVESSGEESTAIGGAFGEFLDYMAGQFPLTGMGTIDKILWAVIIVVGGITIIGIAIRVIL